MPQDARKVLPQDLMSDTEYAKVRRERRVALLPMKRLRRIELGPFCTIFFENYETMLFQIQEMLLTEKGGAEQIPDELEAYNPLIPQGSELVATVMFEIDDPARREAALARLGGAEDLFFIQVGAERVMATPEGDVERTREDGKTAAVHFLHFQFVPEQIAHFRDPATTIFFGCDHERYRHLAGLSPATRAELARDFG